MATKKSATKKTAKRPARTSPCPFCGAVAGFTRSKDRRPVSRCGDCGHWSGD